MCPVFFGVFPSEPKKIALQTPHKKKQLLSLAFQVHNCSLQFRAPSFVQQHISYIHIYIIYIFFERIHFRTWGEGGGWGWRSGIACILASRTRVAWTKMWQKGWCPCPLATAKHNKIIKHHACHSACIFRRIIIAASLPFYPPAPVFLRMHFKIAAPAFCKHISTLPYCKEKESRKTKSKLGEGDHAHQDTLPPQAMHAGAHASASISPLYPITRGIYPCKFLSSLQKRVAPVQNQRENIATTLLQGEYIKKLLSSRPP